MIIIDTFDFTKTVKMMHYRSPYESGNYTMCNVSTNTHMWTNYQVDRVDCPTCKKNILKWKRSLLSKKLNGENTDSFITAKLINQCTELHLENNIESLSIEDREPIICRKLEVKLNFRIGDHKIRAYFKENNDELAINLNDVIQMIQDKPDTNVLESLNKIKKYINTK